MSLIGWPVLSFASKNNRNHCHSIWDSFAHWHKHGCRLTLSESISYTRTLGSKPGNSCIQHQQIYIQIGSESKEYGKSFMQSCQFCLNIMMITMICITAPNGSFGVCNAKQCNWILYQQPHAALVVVVREHVGFWLHKLYRTRRVETKGQDVPYITLRGLSFIKYSQTWTNSWPLFLLIDPYPWTS